METITTFTNAGWDFTNTWAMSATYPILQGVTADIWTGSGNWSTTSHWSLGAVPISTEVAVFNAGDTSNSTIDTAFTVGGVSILGYTGTITQSANLTVSGTYSQSSGTFTGGAYTITANNVTLSEGTLTAPSGTFDVSGNWNVTGGTFTAGSNTVTFNGSGAQALTSGGQSFYNLTIANSGRHPTGQPDYQ